jgi:outer membrane cobalamin receptor
MSRLVYLWVSVLAAGFLLAQARTGELRLEVRDAAGLPLEVSGELLSEASQVRQNVTTDAEGRATARGLPFGMYRLTLQHEGFAPFSELIEIRSEAPLYYQAVMRLAVFETTVQVEDAGTLLDPHRTGTTYYIGAQALAEAHAAAPGRETIDLVQSQPGWVLEANGVLHPRGAEYNTQYVLDGVPMLDNRSPPFAAALAAEELQSMDVLTANYPAEYGRKLGGVVELSTVQSPPPGWHWKAQLGGGSFDTEDGFISGQYTRGRISGDAAVTGSHTERFLDPPVEQNYTNKMSGGSVSGRLAAEITDHDRLTAYFHAGRDGFLVPNEYLQQQAGQRQDRRNQETMGQLAYQRVLSPHALASLRVMGRDLSAGLWSNELSTPVLASQERGFREGYAGGALSLSAGAHEIKAGADAIFTSVYERFADQVTDSAFFDPDVPRQFQFAGQRRGNQEAGFAQDLIRWGPWTVSAGLRWDRYQLLVTDTAFSPRLGVAYYWRGAGLVLRASYDRAFETPAIENLLLASSHAAQTLTPETTGLAVPPSRGNFYQAGFGKSLWGKLRLDANYFAREIRNFSDDDLLLNTGVSFPIAFASAAIHGVEAKLEVPRWGRFSGFLSYSNLVGIAQLPVTGGLFVESGSADLLRTTGRFPISQDQRNTVHAQLRVQAASRLWFSLAGNYGSGLPAELEPGTTAAAFAGEYSAAVLSRVNFARGRVRPQFWLDASAGVQLWKSDRRALRLQVDALNVTDRLNVINFAGLFSGTALANPRMFAARLATEF